MSNETCDLPTIDELALGAFLHDAGKLLQRGLGSSQALPERVRGQESTLCPLAGNGTYHTHKHVLFTELLFHDLEEAKLALPAALRRETVRDCAVFHHKPRPEVPWDRIVVEADHLASGMDRKEKDLSAEGPDDEQRTRTFRTTPLKSISSSVRLSDRKLSDVSVHAPLPADPETIVPRRTFSETEMVEAYRATSEAFRRDWLAHCRELQQSVSLFHEGVIGLAERYWWAVPSSTRDEPDVSLLDHSLAVAAFAACLFKHHEARGELLDEAAIKDRARAKFRLLRGDLSGIQSCLFRLGSEQVKGVNRILRARSFLMGQLVEAAGLLLRRRLGLPPYVLLMRAGGQFTMLLPELAGIEATIAAIQAEIDRWMATRYAGELALVLGLTEPLAPEQFLRSEIGKTLDRVRVATEAAKERPLAAFLASNGPILEEDYEEGADGNCPACGVRPRKAAFTEDGVSRCEACHHEYRLGRKLPKLRQLLWLDGPGDERALTLFGEVRLRAVVGDETPLAPGRNIVSGWRPWGVEDVAWPITSRPIANYVPMMSEDELGLGKYRDLDAEEGLEVGDLKTMGHLACDAREPDGDRWIGRPLLAVLKADVDNLGQIFGMGLGKDRSIGRLVALSRAVDWYFTGCLPHLLERRFSNTYTVYAGGDDLLLIGPWLQTVQLARALREDFGRYAGGNPSLTLSAGIAIVSAREPLNRSAHAAEQALEQAKRWKPKGQEKEAAPKDRLGILDRVLAWDDQGSGLPWLLDKQDWLCERLREREAATAFAYKLLSFLELRDKAEDPKKADPAKAIWRARYGYFLARTYPPSPAEQAARRQPAIWSTFNALMGLDSKDRRPPSRLAIAFAVWRNR